MDAKCECSDDLGPCERHGETLVSREGASVRTADELMMVLISDLLDCGAELSAHGREERDRLAEALEAAQDEQTGSAWFSNPDDVDAAVMLADQLEADVADLYVIHDDGYVIVRPTADCPLG